MRAITVFALGFGLLVPALVAPSATTAQEAPKTPKVLKGSPTKNLKALGTKVSRVTTYTAKKDGGGFVINCSAECPNGTSLHWQCEPDPQAIAVQCVPHCRPPPAHGLCYYY